MSYLLQYNDIYQVYTYLDSTTLPLVYVLEFYAVSLDQATVIINRNITVLSVFVHHYFLHNATLLTAFR